MYRAACQSQENVHNKIPDSRLRGNDVTAAPAIPGKTAGRDPESRFLTQA